MRTLANSSRLLAASAAMLAALFFVVPKAQASSHREAPLISNDPLADNTDLYAFVSPDDPTMVTIIADYIPFEVPQGGPNFATFGTNIHYEVHIKNNAATAGDDITYRFTFSQTNGDPTTFFNIRLGKQNLMTTYVCEKSTDGGSTWNTIVANGTVPPPNIGPRSIEGAAGLNMPYSTLMQNAVATATDASHETIFCGPIDDPFFVDLGGIFDLGGFNKHGKDGLAGFNCHTIALKIPISSLQKDGMDVSQAANILDGNFVIGVWASASRLAIRTINGDGTYTETGSYVQVSRLGMPLTNEAIIPIGMKDKWNSGTPYTDATGTYNANFVNPELALYCGSGAYSAAVPGLAALRIDTNSLGLGLDFRNGKNGLYPLLGSAGTKGTALDTAGGPAAGHFGAILIGAPASPRSVDLLPIFYTGVPNAAPYQLATGKAGNPLAAGKPFINNFLPTLGDMLRLNMAVPATPRTSKDFSSEGLIQAAVLGLTDSRFDADASLQDIPNMDGFPNGRRLEDDVTTIEMQAVGGLVLNAIGLWTDDYIPGTTASPLTPFLLAKLGWDAGVTKNDVPLQSSFPYVAAPHRGSLGLMVDTTTIVQGTAGVNNVPQSIGIHAPGGQFTGQNYPNPVTTDATTFQFHISAVAPVSVTIVDVNGSQVATSFNQQCVPGDYSSAWQLPKGLSSGDYFAILTVNGEQVSTMRFVVNK
jgi:Domain of unknown function (DUF4331)